MPAQRGTSTTTVRAARGLLVVSIALAACGAGGDPPAAVRLWLAGTARCRAVDGGAAFVARSDDAGRTWSLFAGPGSPDDPDTTFEQLVFVDRVVGWAAARGRFWRTADGGASWRDVTGDLMRPDTLALRVASVTFPRPARGVVVGSETIAAAAGATPTSRPLVALTQDGGALWTRPRLTELGAQRSDLLRAVCLDASGLGLAVGTTTCNAHGCVPPAAGGGDLLIATTDEGSTWRDVTARFGAGVFGSAYCAGNGDLWTDRDHLYGLVHSADAGDTWTEQQLPIDSFEWPVGERFSAPDPSHAWFATEASSRSEQHLFASGDAGERWEERPLPPLDENEALDAVHFADGDLGVLSGGPGLCQLQPPVAFVSQDGGGSWQRRDLPTAATGARFSLIATYAGG